MRHVQSIVVMFAWLQISGCAYAETASTEDWFNFLQKPETDTSTILVENIASHVEKCDWGSSENQLAVPPEIRQGLFDLISSGNSASLEVGLYVERCLDGGDLGDLRRSAGQFFDKDSEGFLKEIQSSSVSTERYTSILTMLPLVLVDNLDGKIAATRYRISLLRKIDTPEYLDLKGSGIAALEVQEGFLLNVRSSN